MRLWIFLAIACSPLGACATRPPAGAADSTLLALAPAGSAPQRTANGNGLFGCYRKVYVPAVIRVDTQGRLVRPERRFFEVVQEGGQTRWNKVVEPAIFLETRRILHKDHYTLERVDCPADGATVPTIDATRARRKPG